MAFGGILKLVEMLKAATSILIEVVLWYAELVWESSFIIHQNANYQFINT